MGKTKREPSHVDSFHKHYAAIWGEVRWRESLYPALARPTRHAALLNRFARPGKFDKSLTDARIAKNDLVEVSFPNGEPEDKAFEGGPFCIARHINKDELDKADGLSFPQPSQSHDDDDPFLTHWNMDAASVLAAKVLDVRNSHAVLDLCGAPGGKSIALAQELFAASDTAEAHSAVKAILCSNEADRTRFRRLSENLKAYLPSHLDVRRTNIDATSPNSHRELATAGGWDRVLIDAPCSSERHIIHAHAKAQASGRVAPEIASWRPGSTKRLQETQLKLLMAGLRLAKYHGKVLYATCSIEPGENDGVIEKARALITKERKKGLISWDVELALTSSSEQNAEDSDLQATLESTWAERTKYGWIVLPDHPAGGRWGPLFFALLIKVPSG